MDDWTGKYLVAGPAVYRIDHGKGATLHLTIIAGSETAVGKTVNYPRSCALANLETGHERLTDQPPASGGEEQSALPGVASAGKRKRGKK